VSKTHRALLYIPCANGHEISAADAISVSPPTAKGVAIVLVNTNAGKNGKEGHLA